MTKDSDALASSEYVCVSMFVLTGTEQPSWLTKILTINLLSDDNSYVYN